MDNKTTEVPTHRDLEQLKETRKLIRELSWVLDREHTRCQTIPIEYIRGSVNRLKYASGLTIEEIGVDIPCITDVRCTS